MKIKQDFVTNSSSCSYVVCIPDGKKFTDELNENLKGIIENPEEVIGSRFYYSEYIDFSDLDYEIFDKIHEVIQKMGYILMYIEDGPDDQKQYLNIAGDKTMIKQIKNILEKVDIML